MSNRNNMFFYYHKDDEIEEKLAPLIELAKENNFNIVEDDESANVIVSVGGDGMFLQAVRQTGFRQDALYAGLTREGESSLYCDFNLDSFDELLHSVLHDEMEVRKFPVIKTTVNDGRTFYCLNELTIRSTIVKTIVLDVYIDDQHFETFRGDGMVVSTPTGSTGYNKSNKGAIVDPLIPCYQISEISSMNNNNFRTLGSSFILSKGRTLKLVEIEDGNDHPIVSFDNEAYPIRKIDKVEISMDDTVVKTVKLKNNSYWNRVQRMFL
ncbi:NAD kinase [Oceanobacillus halophilus]|uniref:NAD kinase n=1 Tax=Oceanobacillus halophilus TaxID=930130 RepID=A0A494ZVJ4_9BACI|nr:NAD kinase [Oceanobacillus halophilus]RKQ30552.1 NAD kinase [Oceanobacillus halophilus]